MTVRSISAVDVHVAGEASRVLMDSGELVKGTDMPSRLAYCRNNLQWLRRLMLSEPRGYPGLLGSLVVPPVSAESDFGIVILEQADFAPMSGVNLMCAVTAMIETGRLSAREPVTTVRVDTASGTVAAQATVVGGRVKEVSLRNVASFVVAHQHDLLLPEYGGVPVDIAFGGQFYVQASAERLGVRIAPESSKELIRAGNALLAAAREEFPLQHPEQQALNEVQLPLIHAPVDEPGIDCRSVVVMPHGRPELEDPRSWDAGSLDRSPGGTGTCARMAVQYERGALGLGEDFVTQSVLGTTLTGNLERVASVGPHPAVVPVIIGRGWITGFHEFVVAPDDPFPEGFRLDAG